jgi:hypothetical protein
MANGKMNIPQWVIAVAVIAVVYFLFVGRAPADTETPVTPQQELALTPEGQCAQNPSYSYTAVDAFSLSTTVTGTTYIKQNDRSPVTTLANPTHQADLKLWLENTSGYLCEVADLGSVKCGSQSVQTECYKNATTVTLAMIDTKATPNAAVNNGGTSNATIGTNDIGYFDIQYTGTSKESFMPFGGCVAIEYPRNITSVTVSGALSSEQACPYKWTYGVSSTDNTFITLAVPEGFDAEKVASRKVAQLTLQTGSAPVLDSNITVTFQQAAYYIANDGNFYIGIEKDQDQDPTNVGESVSLDVIISDN